MRKLAIGLALASTALASPALARDGQWYVGVEGGAMLVEDLDLDTVGANNAIIQNHEAGYDFDGIVGYDFGGFRLETEVAYKAAAIDSTNAFAAAIPGSQLWDLTFSVTLQRMVKPTLSASC